MQRAATSIDGTRYANTIFYAIESTTGHSLFHQLWTY
jgi:hypothetical protein